jgi:acetyl esterase/lipase
MMQRHEQAPQLPEGVKPEVDIVYARRGDHELTLDLYRREHADVLTPVVVWIHGGAWIGGSKGAPFPALVLLARGYAVASIGYRLSQEALFPAQIKDCKAAVRWLRANAEQCHFDPDRFGAWGSSAGGHLAALLGTSGGVRDLEGKEGNLEYSSRVQAVCDWFGPTDFLRMNDVRGIINHDAADSPESRLIGGPIQEHSAEVARANPISYVTPDDPPFLIMHGDRDRTVPLNQSELLHAALQKAGVESTLVVVPGSGHGFRGATSHWQEVLQRRPQAFFDRHLRGI